MRSIREWDRRAKLKHEYEKRRLASRYALKQVCIELVVITLCATGIVAIIYLMGQSGVLQ